jgi:carbon storage regulator CsrA
MLVLSRKSNESIVIGDQIVIEILEISNNKIRIGIAAPANVRVVRGELTPKAPLQSRIDSVAGRNEGQLPRLRRNGSGNPHLRTVADAARHRLRQLRQQLNPGAVVPGSTRDNGSSPAVISKQLDYQRTETNTTGLSDGCTGLSDGCNVELVGQEVAERTSDYRISQPSRNGQPYSQRRSLAIAEDDPATRREVYWQVEALNQYRSEWVAEAESWYETEVASVSVATV